MLRLPLLKLCSRQTRRMAVGSVIINLDCHESLPVERMEPLGALVASEMFFVYYFCPRELGDENATFMLVQVMGNEAHEEKVLEYGTASLIAQNGAGFQHFSGMGAHIGMYEYYCPLVKTTGRHHTWPKQSEQECLTAR